MSSPGGDAAILKRRAATKHQFDVTVKSVTGLGSVAGEVWIKWTGRSGLAKLQVRTKCIISYTSIQFVYILGITGYESSQDQQWQGRVSHGGWIDVAGQFSLSG